MLKTETADEISAVYKSFKSIVKNEKQGLGYRIQRFRSDRSDHRTGEYDNDQFRAILQESGIALELSAPYTKHQNGVSERKLQSIQNAVISMLYASNLRHIFWAEGAITEIYLLNQSPTSALYRIINLHLMKLG